MENICQFIIENIDKNSLNIKKNKTCFQYARARNYNNFEDI